MRRRLAALITCVLVVLGVFAVTPDARAADIPISLVYPDGRPLISLPKYAGAPAEILDYGPRGSDFTATWSLENAAGDTVIAPVQGPAPSVPGLIHLSVDPAAHLTSPLPDGVYTLRVVNTFQVDGTTQTAEATQPLTLLADPPVDTAPVVSPVRTNIDAGSSAAAAWNVEMGDVRTAASSQLQVRNAAGRLVWTDPWVNRDCGFSCDDSQRHVYTPYWDGGTDVEDWAPRGIYTATLVLTDHYGRPARIPLGSAHVYRLIDLTRTFTARPVLVRTAAGRITGRCSSEVVNRSTGAVQLRSGSRCRARKGNADVVVQRFRVSLPAIAMTRLYEVDSTVRVRAPHGVMLREHLVGGGAWHSLPIYHATRTAWRGPLQDVYFANRPAVQLGHRVVEVAVRVQNGRLAAVRGLRVRVRYQAWAG